VGERRRHRRDRFCEGLSELTDRDQGRACRKVEHPRIGSAIAQAIRDNKLDYEAYGAGYVAAVAYHTQLSGRVNLWKGFKGF